MIRVALRSTRRLFREALTGCLGPRAEFEVVGAVADLKDLRVLCALRHPDVAVVDVGAHADRETVHRLRDCVDVARLVVVYERLSPIELTALWQVGVDAVMPGSHGLDALVVLLQRYVTAYRNPPPRPGGLTPQEAHIITLLSLGHTVNQIARSLGIGTSAIANAKRRIYRKLDVAGQCEVVARATALGLINRPTDRPAVPVGPQGPVVAVLRGAAGATADLVSGTLLAAGIPVLDGEATGRRPAGARPFTVLVDPAPEEWPTERDDGAPIALVCTKSPSRAQAVEALAHGAITVVLADRVVTDLVPAMTLAAHGHLSIEAGTAKELLGAISGPSAPSVPQLTAREYDILRSIADGHTVRLTARALGIAEKTVENTQARLFRKLGVRNRLGALAAAHALGLLETKEDALLP